MAASLPNLSPEEQEQLQQTIEMFEVIVQASPQDTQSLEILKDAYSRLGKPESTGIARRLADTYRELGQLSQALIEYEQIAQSEPENVQVTIAIGEIEALLAKNVPPKGPTSAPSGSIKLDFGNVVVEPGSPAELGTLITTNQTQRHDPGNGAGGATRLPTRAVDDSNEMLGKFLMQNRLVPEEIIISARERVQKKNRERSACR
jgi:tetratricopeptide (TPR) repeat protein